MHLNSKTQPCSLRPPQLDSALLKHRLCSVFFKKSCLTSRTSIGLFARLGRDDHQKRPPRKGGLRTHSIIVQQCLFLEMGASDFPSVPRIPLLPETPHKKLDVPSFQREFGRLQLTHNRLAEDGGYTYKLSQNPCSNPTYPRYRGAITGFTYSSMILTRFHMQFTPILLAWTFRKRPLMCRNTPVSKSVTAVKSNHPGNSLQASLARARPQP